MTMKARHYKWQYCAIFFFFSGQVGDWKNHFTVAQSELFDQKTEKEMKGSIFKFDYSL